MYRVHYRVQQHLILAGLFAALGIIWPSIVSKESTAYRSEQGVPLPHFSAQDLFPLKHAVCSPCGGVAAASALVTFNQSARAAARR